MRHRPTENVSVNNVILRSRSAALRIGPNAAGARNFTFSNVEIYDSNRGIMLQARASETIENILFSNITIQTRFVDAPGWWGNGEPVSITVAKWAYQSWKPAATTLPSPQFGLIRHVRFSNVTAAGASPFTLYSTAPGRIQDVGISGLSMTMQASALTPVLGGNLELTPTTPLTDGLFRRDLSAIMLHNAEDVSLDHTRVQWEGNFPAYYRRALSAEAVHRLRVHDFLGTANAPRCSCDCGREERRRHARRRTWRAGRARETQGAGGGRSLIHHPHDAVSHRRQANAHENHPSGDPHIARGAGLAAGWAREG